MEWLSDFVFAFFGGFARIFIGFFILWMIGIIGLLFMELFNNEEFQFRVYLNKIGKVLLISFQIAIFGSVVIGPILLFKTEEYLTYTLVTIDGILLSILYFFLRRRLGKFDSKKSD